MISKDSIKTSLNSLRVNDKQAAELADKISQYAVTYNLEDSQIEGLLTQFNTAPALPDIENLRGKRDAIKESLLKKITE